MQRLLDSWRSKGGQGLERRRIAYNYFYLIGPKDDPANVKGMNASLVLVSIMDKEKVDPAKVMFVSRGGNSGTHSNGKQLWKKAGYNYSAVNSFDPWYLEARPGMDATSNIANEKQAYNLPTVTVVRMVFLLISHSEPLGGLNLLFSPTGMVFGQAILVSPIMIGLNITALEGIGPQIRDTARSLSATEMQIIVTEDFD
jgi:hypothetical protein